MANDNKKTKTIKAKANDFQRINPHAAGIDIGAHSIFVCVGLEGGRQEICEFLTFTADLKASAAWLKKCNITSIAMESTGSYWIPVYEILEDEGFEVHLINAHHLKAIPGKKTDIKDCQWIQQLHSYGLLRGSFRPDNHGVTFRSYVRQRSRLIELSSVQIQLMNKAMIQMNIRLDQVFSEISGVSSMLIIRSIVSGERSSAILAKHRQAQCKKTEADIMKALEGNFRPEHVFSLEQSLRIYDCIQNLILECNAKIEEMLNNWYEPQNKTLQASDPSNCSDAIESEKNENVCNAKKKKPGKNAYNFDATTALKNVLKVDLTKINGIDSNTVIKIISEIGTDMSRWATVKHFVSWLGLCPGNKISGGKVLSSHTIPTSNRAKQAFRMAANALHHSKSALGAYFRHMRARLGAPGAIIATAHKLAKTVYVMLRDKKDFHDIGQNAYEQQFEKRKIANLKRMAKEMGFVLHPA
jgi:transposase